MRENRISLFGRDEFGVANGEVAIRRPLFNYDEVINFAEPKENSIFL